MSGSVIFASSPAAKMIDLDLTSRASPTTATNLDIFVNRITLFNFHGKPLFIGTFEYLINLENREFFFIISILNFLTVRNPDILVLDTVGDFDLFAKNLLATQKSELYEFVTIRNVTIKLSVTTLNVIK